MDNKIKLFVRFLALSIFLLILMILAPKTLALLKGGFESEQVLSQTNFYIQYGISYLVGLIAVFLLTLLIYKYKGEYGIGIGYSELGETPSARFFKRFSTIQILFLSIIFFLSLGIFSFVTKQQSFTGLDLLPQQFTAVQSIIYSTLLIPAAENLGAAFVLAASLLILRFVSKKYNLGKNNFIGFAYLTPIIVAIFWFAWHVSVYSGSDVNLVTVFIFGLLGGFITLITGSFIPFLIMHMSNNLLFDLGRFFSNETLIIYSVALIVSIFILYILIYKDSLFGKNREVIE